MCFALLPVSLADHKDFWPSQLTDSWLEVFAAVCAAVAFGLGLWQYIRAQNWQRTQFLAEEMAKFRSHVLISKAISMLDDYGERDIELFSDEDRSKRIVSVTAETVRRALAEKDTGDDEFVCNAIRDAFDALFNGLEHFECLVGARLLTVKQLKPFLAYWIEQFADEERSRKGADFVIAARAYIARYYFDEVQDLSKRFGYDLRANTVAGETQ